jgi:hypothetical protein
MRTRALLAVTTIVGLLLGSSAQAADEKFTTVRDLYQRCASRSTEMRLVCGMYLLGVANAMAMVGGLYKDDGPKGYPSDTFVGEVFVMSICGATPYSPEQLIQILMNWAKQHPEQWQLPQFSGAVNALREAWPCQPN